VCSAAAVTHCRLTGTALAIAPRRVSRNAWRWVVDWRAMHGWLLGPSRAGAAHPKCERPPSLVEPYPLVSVAEWRRSHVDCWRECNTAPSRAAPASQPDPVGSHTLEISSTHRLGGAGRRYMGLMHGSREAMRGTRRAWPHTQLAALRPYCVGSPTSGRWRAAGAPRRCGSARGRRDPATSAGPIPGGRRCTTTRSDAPSARRTPARAGR
jgi:hypothetical protein